MDRPDRAMVVTPHPDDAEIGCGGTIAGWIDQGTVVVYVLCTNGDKGSGDPEMTSKRLAEIREREQAEAADVLGVREVIYLRYPDGALGNIHVSWLNPRKARTITVVGQRKMAHWDDIDASTPLSVYDKGLDEPPYYDSFGEFQYLLRNADVHVPHLKQVEPLVNQANAFLDAVLDRTPCRAGAPEADVVIAVLEAATRSLQSDGRSCPVSSTVTGEPAYADRATLAPPRTAIGPGAHWRSLGGTSPCGVGQSNRPTLPGQPT